MEKMFMKLACSFNGWLKRKYGVIDARSDYYGKEVHMTRDGFFKMFDAYERIEHYGITHDKVYVHEDGVTYFALVESEV